MKILFLINFWAYAVSLGIAMLLVYQLFKLLEKKHPKYYKSIGRPLLLAPADLAEGSYTRLIKGGFFGYAMVFRGIPKDFPKDTDLRKLAGAIRIALTVLIILFITLIIVGYLFYKSGQQFSGLTGLG